MDGIWRRPMGLPTIATEAGRYDIASSVRTPFKDRHNVVLGQPLSRTSAISATVMMRYEDRLPLFTGQCGSDRAPSSPTALFTVAPLFRVRPVPLVTTGVTRPSMRLIIGSMICPLLINVPLVVLCFCRARLFAVFLQPLCCSAFSFLSVRCSISTGKVLPPFPVPGIRRVTLAGVTS